MQHFFPIALPRAATRSACESLIRFDACNVPEPDSLRHLARQLQSNENFGAVIVKFRCINKKRNLLTRFISLESSPSNGSSRPGDGVCSAWPHSRAPTISFDAPCSRNSAKEDSPLNILLIALSYFTYRQMWIPVVLKGAYDDFVRKREHVWVKTPRFRQTGAN